MNKVGKTVGYNRMNGKDRKKQILRVAAGETGRASRIMLEVNALTGGRPGFISDPLLDTSTRRIVYAHCVASNRPFGPQGPANPFKILAHSEDRKGASVRSILPAGYMTRTLEIGLKRKEILFHQAKAVGNDLNDRVCRTKLVAEPIGDFEKLITFWDLWNGHRVMVYGDLKGRPGIHTASHYPDPDFPVRAKTHLQERTIK